MPFPPGAVAGAALVGVALGVGAAAPTVVADQPNILFVVLDDIGIDQMGIRPFGWNESPFTPEMPVLQAIADAGVSFTNFWATPECSPSRACMLTGRWGHRTGVVTAIIDPMLPVDQLNPVEITVPKLLGPSGYRSAMIGKYHLAGGPENSPPGLGYNAPAVTAGLDHYDGYWDLPPSIDPTIGGQVSGFDCGGPNGSIEDPAVYYTPGAACFPDGHCEEGLLPFEAMALGGLPLMRSDGTVATTCDDPEASCSNIDWSLTNAYYAWPRTTVDERGNYTQEPVYREYLTDFVAERATQWIMEPGPAGDPWLCYVTHSSAHTPIQTPPPALIGDTQSPGGSCQLPSTGSVTVEFKQQFKLMCESVDRSVGDMLLDLGLATMEDGVFTLVDPRKTNTMIVVMGDNGSLGFTVNDPFSRTQAKQTVYETGVHVGCIVAGPDVVAPGRAVDAMVNVVDLFGLFCDVGGVNWRAQIPPSRTMDVADMLPYLTNPRQAEIRDRDFAIYGAGTFAPGESGGCVLVNQVVDGLITSASLCQDNGGCWIGGDAPPYKTYADYCGQVLTSDCTDENGNPIVYCFAPLADGEQCPEGAVVVTSSPARQMATRRRDGSGAIWKLIVTSEPACQAPPAPVSEGCTVALYKLAPQVPPSQGGIESDRATESWSPLSEKLPPDAQAMYEALRLDMLEILGDEWYCPGDGNKDRRIDSLDIEGVLAGWGGPSFWDLDENGITDGADLGMVLANWNPDCTGAVNPKGQGIPECLLTP